MQSLVTISRLFQELPKRSIGYASAAGFFTFGMDVAQIVDGILEIIVLLSVLTVALSVIIAMSRERRGLSIAAPVGIGITALGMFLASCLLLFVSYVVPGDDNDSAIVELAGLIATLEEAESTTEDNSRELRINSTSVDENTGSLDRNSSSLDQMTDTFRRQSLYNSLFSNTKVEISSIPGPTERMEGSIKFLPSNDYKIASCSVLYVPPLADRYSIDFKEGCEAFEIEVHDVESSTNMDASTGSMTDASIYANLMTNPLLIRVITEDGVDVDVPLHQISTAIYQSLTRLRVASSTQSYADKEARKGANHFFENFTCSVYGCGSLSTRHADYCRGSLIPVTGFRLKHPVTGEEKHVRLTEACSDQRVRVNYTPRPEVLFRTAREVVVDDYCLGVPKDLQTLRLGGSVEVEVELDNGYRETRKVPVSQYIWQTVPDHAFRLTPETGGLKSVAPDFRVWIDPESDNLVGQLGVGECIEYAGIESVKINMDGSGHSNDFPRQNLLPVLRSLETEYLSLIVEHENGEVMGPYVYDLEKLDLIQSLSDNASVPRLTCHMERGFGFDDTDRGGYCRAPRTLGSLMAWTRVSHVLYGQTERLGERARVSFDQTALIMTEPERDMFIRPNDVGEILAINVPEDWDTVFYRIVMKNGERLSVRSHRFD